MIFRQLQSLILFIIPCLIAGKNFSVYPKESELPALFTKFLNVPIPFTDSEEESKCNTIVDALTPEEIHIAARTSYSYWYLEDQTDTRPSPDLERQSALREARRHLMATDGDVQKAIERLQSVCQYRKEHQLDLLRVAFSNDPRQLQQQYDSKDLDTLNDMQQCIESDMAKQPVVMKGTDYQSRAVLFKFPRRIAGTTEKEYLTTQLYVADRANAVIEYVSQGHQESMVAVFDFSEARSSYSPKLKWQISAVRALQHLYPERLHKLVILEPPFWLRGLYHSIRPFLSKKTSNKIQVVSDRTKLCGDVLDCREEVVSTLQDDIDLDHYLHKIPFYCPYDCEPYDVFTETQ